MYWAQDKIFKLCVDHFYVRSLLHGVICVTKCEHPSNCFFSFKITNILFCYSNSHDFRQSFGSSISITAQCIEPQLMPNEGSGKDLQIMCWSLLRQISPSWRNLHHKVWTSVKLFLFILLLSFFLFLLATFRLPYLSNWQYDFNETWHIYSWVVLRIVVQDIIDLTDDLDLSRSQLYKITLWAISRFLLEKLSPNFNTE